MSDYVYDRLPSTEHIRLIDVGRPPTAGRKKDAKLVLNLVTVSLTNLPWYECVSYAWVSNHRSQRIETTTGTNIAVTGSLLEALPCLVAACQTGYLHVWIDQLCINQDDVEERSSQVAMMSGIYQTAWTLLVWLGQRSLDACLFLQLLDQLPQYRSRPRWCYDPANDKELQHCCEDAVDNIAIRRFFKARVKKLALWQPLKTSSYINTAKHKSDLDTADVMWCYYRAAMRTFDLPWVIFILVPLSTVLC